MADTVTSSEFHSRTDLPDWRVLGGWIEARFRAGSFARAAEFVQQIAGAADAANHHPEIDLRHPDVVHVALSTHEVSGLTSDDVGLATTISSLAEQAGVDSEPLASARVEVAIDAMDIDAVGPFWKAVLGYVDDPSFDDGEQVIVIVDPLRIGPAFWFQQMDAPRPQRNRFHIDVIVPHDVAEERLAAAIEAGGRLLTDQHARAFWVLADPEDNEACICTWQDRD